MHVSNLKLFHVMCKGQVAIRTLQPAKGAVTRTIPYCSVNGNSSARTTHPDVPAEIARKEKWRSLPLSNAILQGTASAAQDKDHSGNEITLS